MPLMYHHLQAGMACFGLGQKYHQMVLLDPSGLRWFRSTGSHRHSPKTSWCRPCPWTPYRRAKQSRKRVL